MKNKQGITIAALIIAIVGLSIGFAAFSNTLTISSSASVNPSEENFIVQFSKYQDSDATGTSNPITPTALTSEYGENGLIPDSNKKSLQDLKATFTTPGQSVTYELYVRNTGAYVAYLKDLVFANAEHATNGETYKHCYAATEDSNGDDIPTAQQATGTLVSAACNGISISVSIGTATNITPDSASKSLGNQALAANNGNVKATITISYTGNDFVDGPMEVEFGDISFIASSNPGTSNEQQGGQGGNEQQETPSEQQVADELIPTAEEKNASDIDEDDPVTTYTFFSDENTEVYYTEMFGVVKGVNVNTNQGNYIWYCDSDSASSASENAETTILPNKWYNSEGGTPTTIYTGSSPISLASLNIQNPNIESYLTRVINSFNN